MRLSRSRLSWRCGRLLTAALVLALAASGCRQSPTTSTPAGPTQPTAAGIEKPAPEEVATFPPPPADTAAGELVCETWDALSMRSGDQLVRVGYARTTIRKTKGPDGQDVLRTANFTRMIIDRAGQISQQDLPMISLDTPDNRLVAFETELNGVKTTGLVRGSVLEIRETSLGRTQTRSIPWQAEWSGPLGPEWSARRQPLKPGERRTIRGLMQVVNAPGDTVLTAGDYETVKLPGGARKLLKVSSTMQLGAQQIESTQWADEKGETIKSLMPSAGQEMIRTTKEDALRRTPGGRLDLLVTSTVPLPGGFPGAQQSRKAVYLATVKNGKIDGVFPNSISQQVQLKDERTAELIVIAVRQGEPKETPVAAPPTADDLAPSSYLQSDDPAIIELGNSVAPRESDPWKVACALEKFVDDFIQQKSFSEAFATASQVVRTREGDCTEHAMLFAALCRVRKIPARCAFGLIYFEPLKGFAFHMWTEVWIADRWVPMDATLGQGGIAADHLKLGDTSLSGPAALAPLIAVTNAFGRLELKLVSAE